MSENCWTRIAGGLMVAVGMAIVAAPTAAEMMLAGIDNKVSFAGASTVFGPPGKDFVSVIDIANPSSPRIIANLQLDNSLFGPPTNLAITPDGSLALINNAMAWNAEGDGWKPGPDNRLFVVDLTVDPPQLIDTVEVGGQPSGMAINRAGDLALIAHRADNSIGVLEISGKSVRLVQTLDMGEQVTTVAITPDGRRALVAKFPAHKIAVLDIENGRISTNAELDMPVGRWPYNVKITPDGTLALTADNGRALRRPYRHGKRYRLDRRAATRHRPHRHRRRAGRPGDQSNRRDRRRDPAQGQCRCAHRLVVLQS